MGLFLTLIIILKLTLKKHAESKLNVTFISANKLEAMRILSWAKSEWPGLSRQVLWRRPQRLLPGGGSRELEPEEAWKSLRKGGWLVNQKRQRRDERNQSAGKGFTPKFLNQGGLDPRNQDRSKESEQKRKWNRSLNQSGGQGTLLWQWLRAPWLTSQA